MTLLERRRFLIAQSQAKNENLFDISKVKTTSGVTNNGDGTLTVTAYATSIGKLGTICPNLQVGDIITLSFDTTSTINYLYIAGDVKTNWSRNNRTVVTEEMLVAPILVYCRRVDAVNSPAVYSDIQIKKRSKNLFNVSLIPSSTYVTNNGDGSITLQGGSISRSLRITLGELCPDLKVGDEVVVSAVTNGGKYLMVKSLWHFDKSKTITQEMLDATVYFYTTSTSTTDDYYTVKNIQIELGTEATEYEPYY